MDSHTILSLAVSRFFKKSDGFRLLSALTAACMRLYMDKCSFKIIGRGKNHDRKQKNN